jgi:hypothetical protein
MSRMLHNGTGPRIMPKRYEQTPRVDQLPDVSYGANERFSQQNKTRRRKSGPIVGSLPKPNAKEHTMHPTKSLPPPIQQEPPPDNTNLNTTADTGESPLGPVTVTSLKEDNVKTTGPKQGKIPPATQQLVPGKTVLAVAIITTKKANP